MSISQFIKVLDYFGNLKANNADIRWDSSLRADSPESALFAKASILPVALKELKVKRLVEQASYIVISGSESYLKTVCLVGAEIIRPTCLFKCRLLKCE